MTEEPRLDLSALDPRTDSARWSAFVRGTVERTDPVLARRAIDPLTLIAGWMPSVATAVALLIALLIPVELVLERREAGQEQVDRLVQLSSESLRQGSVPTAGDLARAVDGGARP